ncbi:MAG TPA: inositol 2-dehydrogenase [Propionibacteriaceae bacterium]|nr:inositol 2-dehydrogenase [Propionibacteriaceae bacterium]
MLRLAIIGAGRIGQVHARTIYAHPRAELVLIADPVPGAAAAVAETYGARATENVQDVYADPSIDAVVICSPTACHVDQIIASVAAGKAVLTEKPVDLSVERVDECLAAIAGNEHRVMVGFNRRFDPGVIELKSRLDAGEVGELRQVTIISRDPAAAPAQYMVNSGGIFKDMTIHDFDMARFLLGDIAEVSASGHAFIDDIRGIGDIDTCSVTLTAPSGATATILNSRVCAAGYDQRIEVFGPKGALETTNLRTTGVRSSGAAGTDVAGPYLPFFLERYAAAYSAELDHFITAIEAGTAPSPSIRDGRAALVIAEAAGASLASKAQVPVA